MELLKKLTQTWGVAGREKAVRALIRNEVEPYADEIFTDTLGNLIAVKRGCGDGKKIMMSAHMDEIGLQVTKIEGDGRIRVCKIGWVWAGSVYNDKVVFQNDTIGVVSCVGTIEDAKNDIGKLYIDIGCTTKEETLKHVSVGDFCGFIGEFHALKNGCFTAKSLDDRVGCYLLIEALKINDGKRKNDVYYVFSVQEEVGCRGARVAAERIQPDIGISVDISPDHLYPSDLEGSNAVGAGVGIKLGDPSALLDESLVQRMLDCCNENKIDFQRDVMDRGGTDASSINMSGWGVRVAGISIITRYPHSQSSLASMKDIQSALRLIDIYTALEFAFEE